MVLAKQEYREPSYDELRSIVDRAPEAIFVADREGRYTFVNEAGCELIGYTRDEIVGKTIVDLIPAGEVPHLAEAKRQMLQGGIHVAEWTLRRKDGTWLPVEVNARILGDGQWQGFVRDISSRRAREAERDALLEESDSQRRWLQTVMDALPLAVLLSRPGGRLAFNKRAEELLGIQLTPDGGSAQYASLMFDPEGKPVPPGGLPSDRALAAGDTVVADETVVLRPDGTRIPVLGSAAPIRDAAGRVTGAVALFQDVSERMRIDEAVRENERLLQGIFDLLPVGVWIADASGRIVKGNPAGRRIWRGERYVRVPEYDQYKGWWVETGKRIEAEEWALARALTKGETSIGELIGIQCFDGSFKTIINSAAPLQDERGRIAGAIVVNEDITALHEAQERQRKSEHLLRTVFDLLPVGLWIADREGRIELANPAGRRIWSGTLFVGPEQFGEYRAWWVETGKRIEPDEWALARAIRRGETSRDELIRIQCFDGSFRTVINWAVPIRAEDGQIVGAIAVNEDVTSLQQTQEQLRAAVSEREAILATVAHDLRNPLHGIMLDASTLEMTATTLAGGGEVREVAASILDSAKRMSGLVDDLLAVAVATTAGHSMLTLEPMPSASLLERAAKAAESMLPPGTLRVVSVGRLPTVLVDADRITRVFTNLVDNARKYTSLGGIVTLTGEETAGGVRFSVANSGEPLPRKQIETMFLPFWQATKDRRGTGLGLSICRTIVEEHGGTIWAESAAGQRVRVVFVLPRQTGSPASEPVDDDRGARSS